MLIPLIFTFYFFFLHFYFVPFKVTPAKANPEQQPAESWRKSDDDSSLRKPSATSANAIGLDEVVSINSSVDTESMLSRAEVRRSKSRVRSYLKKCKDAIYGPSSHEDSCPISHHEPISQRATSSWYVNDVSVPSIEDKQLEVRESDATATAAAAEVDAQEAAECPPVIDAEIEPASNDSDDAARDATAGIQVDSCGVEVSNVPFNIAICFVREIAMNISESSIGRSLV